MSTAITLARRYAVGCAVRGARPSSTAPVSVTAVFATAVSVTPASGR